MAHSSIHEPLIDWVLDTERSPTDAISAMGPAGGHLAALHFVCAELLKVRDAGHEKSAEVAGRLWLQRRYGPTLTEAEWAAVRAMADRLDSMFGEVCAKSPEDEPLFSRELIERGCRLGDLAELITWQPAGQLLLS